MSTEPTCTPPYDLIASQLGLNQLGHFSWRHFFGKCWASHDREETEKVLIRGTAQTTPCLSSDMGKWPQPWIFLRVLSASVVSYLIIYWILAVYQQQALVLLPALLVIGSFAIPLSVVVLFFEINTPQNIPLFFLTTVGLLGGAISFLLTFLLFDYFAILTMAYGASAAGFIEESAKLIALLFFVRKDIRNRYPHILNGLLLGATIGTGFSAFESAGYALRAGMESNSFAHLNFNLVLRGLLSPFSHVVWSAMAAGAFWLALRENHSFFKSIFSARFGSLFILSLIFHFCWNLDLDLPLWATIVKNLCLGVLSWAVVLRMVQTGLSEFSSLNEK
jgi:RsiW-degrading membrane proteinase PrsW (M82 family)